MLEQISDNWNLKIIIVGPVTKRDNFITYRGKISVNLHIYFNKDIKENILAECYIAKDSLDRPMVESALKHLIYQIIKWM